MQIEQRTWNRKSGWEMKGNGKISGPAQLVFVFGDVASLSNPDLLGNIKSEYPKADIFGCSTAGEIFDTQVFDDSLVTTAVHFDQCTHKGTHVRLDSTANSFEAGAKLANALDKKDLRHVIVLSDGLGVNGSDLVRGLTQNLPIDVTITGGLSGDGERFANTLVVWNGCLPTNSIAAVGLYGSHLRIGFGSQGGWDPFGPERLVTKSVGNVLYELDGQSALDLYKKYLGEHASGLPATGLLYPLSLRGRDGGEGVVRTLLVIDEKEQSMTFAGDIPEGTYARLMKANFDRLIDGAGGAAQVSNKAISPSSSELALLISCVGRKMVLGQRVEEELEAVRHALGNTGAMTGFYSYGEISPFAPNEFCELHNQTMTITTLTEV